MQPERDQQVLSVAPAFEESVQIPEPTSSVLIKLAIFVFCMLIVAVGIISAAGDLVASSIIEEQIRERLRVAVASRHEMVLSYVSQQHERVRLVASRTKLRRLIQQYHAGEISHEEMRAGTQPILEDAQSQANDFRAIWIVSQEAEILTATAAADRERKFASLPAFEMGVKDDYLGEPEITNDGYVTLLSTPALAQDADLLGVVIVEIDATPLRDILNNTAGLGASGRVNVGRREGDSIHYLFPPFTDPSRMVAANDTPGMAAAIGGMTASEVTVHEGVEVLVRYQPIAYQPESYQAWGIVAQMDVNEAFAPLTRLRRILLILAVTLLVVALGASFLLARRFTMPILALTKTASEVTSGNLSSQVSITTDDEIGVLGQTFNVMTRRLEASYSTLETRVEERTAKLTDEIARRELTQQELQQQAERTKRIIDTATDGFISMDEDGCIVEWNPQAHAMFGWSRDEILGLKVEDTIVPPHKSDAHRRGLERFLKTREARILNERVELSARRRDGSEFDVELTITPLQMGDAFVFNAFFHDITLRKKAEQQLLEARNAAESASTAKSAFLANMSHEIRTPMNGIIGMSELLATTSLRTDQSDYLGMIRQSADSLLRLLNDILDFSKIEAGKLELERVAFSVRNCIGKSGHALSAGAAEKGLKIACRIAPDIPDMLRGDPGRLRQVLVNLAGNSVKFTEQGEVVIDVESERQDDGQITLKVSVRDTGIGISPEKQAVIFEAFNQADSTTTREFGGTGLGLAISKQLVEMMDGRIWVESELGKGTTFSFTVNLGVEQDQTHRKLPKLAAVDGLRVLIVDDNQTNQRILEELLLSWNMIPIIAQSGSDGLRKIEQCALRGEPVRLVLLDCMMPKMNGFEFARALRETVSAEECTIIMLSSAIHPGDASRCERFRIVRCLPKPVIQSDLLEAILSAFGTDETASVPELPPVDTDDVVPRRILLAEDGVVNQRVAVGLLMQHGHEVVVVENGALAVEAAKAENFDLILMDVQMPEMDGFAATAAIRESEQNTDQHIPIIAMTANAMKGDRERCLRAGMDDYVSKPIDAEQLYRAVHAVPPGVLKDRPAHRPTAANQLVSEPETVSAEHGDDGLVNWNLATKNLPGGEPFAIDLAETFLVEIPKLRHALTSAVAENNVELTVRAAHTLKSSLSAFEAVVAVEAALHVEMLAKAGTIDVLQPVAELLELVERVEQELQMIIRRGAETVDPAKT